MAFRRKLGELFFEIGGDTAKFDKAIAKVQQKAKGVAAGFRFQGRGTSDNALETFSRAALVISQIEVAMGLGLVAAKGIAGYGALFRGDAEAAAKAFAEAEEIMRRIPGLSGVTDLVTNATDMQQNLMQQMLLALSDAGMPEGMESNALGNNVAGGIAGFAAGGGVIGATLGAIFGDDMVARAKASEAEMEGLRDSLRSTLRAEITHQAKRLQLLEDGNTAGLRQLDAERRAAVEAQKVFDLWKEIDPANAYLLSESVRQQILEAAKSGGPAAASRRGITSAVQSALGAFTVSHEDRDEEKARRDAARTAAASERTARATETIAEREAFV